jgi:sialic acid synthase SpsE
MTKLYANISLTHHNSRDRLTQRMITAAQCNADAVVINKSTPAITMPADKKYVSISSIWGNLPYIEVANRCEISFENAEYVYDLSKKIGIPIIWCVTDSMAAEFVKEYCENSTVKLHRESVHIYDLARFCKTNFKNVIYSHIHHTEYDSLYSGNRKGHTVYYSTEQFPSSLDQLKYHTIDELIKRGHSVGYECRETGMFPNISLAYRGVEFIEKYLGDDDSDNACVLTPEQFYEYFKNLELMEIANGTPST